jgi:hypothetical protein
MAKTLPLRFQQSLPRGFQFPAQARTLAPALEDLSCFEHLTLGLYLFPPAAAQARAGTATGGGTPLPLLRATVLHLGKDLGHLAGETWELSVFAVPKVVLAAARSVLETEGLPRLRRWLEEAGTRSSSPKARRRSLELRFEPKSATLTSLETP